MRVQAEHALPVLTRAHHAFWLRQAVGRAMCKRFSHKVDPHGQGGVATFFAGTQRALLIKSNPSTCNDVSVKSGEPGVTSVVGGACLSGEIIALE